MTSRATAGALAILAIFWMVWAFIPATNFSGWDEWLVIDLTSRGVLALPFENRPLSLLCNWPGALLLPGTLRGYWLVHGLYLSLTGIVVMALCTRLAPEEPRLALLAGAVAVSWAPLDPMRLDAVLLANYSGFALMSLLGALLLVESARRGRLWLALMGAGLGVAAIRGLESAGAIVAAAPALLWLTVGVSPSVRRRCALAWLLVTGAALAWAAQPLLPGQPGSYQVSGLGFDPHPLRVAGRILRQLGFQLTPLVAPSPREVLQTPALLATAVFAAVWLLRGRGVPVAREAWPRLLRLAAVGLVAATLGHLVLALSRSSVLPLRMQILSAPGMAVLLAAGALLVARLIAPRREWLLAGLAGTALVAIGAGRTAAMQGQWNTAGFWPAQSGALGQIVRFAPGLRPGSFVILLDEVGAFPASFTFRHALRYLYGDDVAGTVWGAEAFLYPVRFAPEGLVSEPYAMIRRPWGVGSRLHHHDELVIVRLDAARELHLLETWPETLPPLPPGARYDPRARLLPDAAPRMEQRLVAAGGTPGR